MITVKAQGKDDISGVSSIALRFYCKETSKSYSAHCSDRDEDGIFEGTIEISQYELDGVFELREVDVWDNAGNYQEYYSKNRDYLPENAKLLPQELSFTVQNDPNHLVSGTQNPNLAEEIKNLPEGAGASVSYESNPHISADVFEAIVGQDKTLTLEGDGIQWEFNGRDIENPKALDLKVDINPIYSTNSPNADALQEQLRGQEVYVLSFPNNGKLPGRAKIRIKADYAFRRYLGTENLYVYYYDNTTQEYIPIAANVDVTDDGWLEFTTDHNSDFVVAKGEITTEETPPVDDGSGDEPPVDDGSEETPPTEDGSGDQDDGSSSDSYPSSDESTSPSGGGWTAPASPQPLRASEAIPKIRSAVRSAAKQAEKNGKAPAAVTVRMEDVSGISPAELVKIQDAIRAQAYPADVLLAFTRREEGKDSDTVTLNPLLLPSGSAVKLTLGNGERKTAALFGRYFKNRMQVVGLSHKGAFGAPVRIRLRLDSGLDAQTLCFYHYDPAKNQYEGLTAPDYSVDKAGYLSFSTSLGDAILITDTPLAKKG